MFVQSDRQIQTYKDVDEIQICQISDFKNVPRYHKANHKVIFFNYTHAQYRQCSHLYILIYLDDMNFQSIN